MSDLDGTPRMHTLYVGSRDGGPFTEEDRQAVVEVVLGTFDGFTVHDAQGYFRGRPVATLLIRIATQDTGAVERVAEAIRRLLDQDTVGIEVGGRYRTVRDSEHATWSVSGVFRPRP